jgi:hypothetical protein
MVITKKVKRREENKCSGMETEMARDRKWNKSLQGGWKTINE